MDRASIIGVVLGVSALIGGTVLEGGSVSFILQPTAALIVFGGTLGATLLSSSFCDVLLAVRSLKETFLGSNSLPFSEYIDRIVALSQVSRREGLVAIEPHLDDIEDPFFRRTLTLAVDGFNPRLLRDTMEEETATFEELRIRQSRVFETAGGFAPTIGIIGAVIGLIHVMQNLSEPARLGEGIAVAFVATIYGVGSANLLFLPISKKLKNRLTKEVQLRRLIVEGAAGIQAGMHPQYLREKLLAFVDDEERTRGMHGRAYR